MKPISFGQFKARYRDALNSLPVDEGLAQKIVAEANRVFRLNCDLLHFLEPKVKDAIGEKQFAEIIGEEKPGSTENTVKLGVIR
ncbi:biliverdin-producing heme oxygenase [Lusitaniella coriacea]|uniref:biliverdin-producing heme oxygenase n=1 Tax=Lusitaniella coriacea TaxID=1983105 RepID=UPI003CF26825